MNGTSPTFPRLPKIAHSGRKEHSHRGDQPPILTAEDEQILDRVAVELRAKWDAEAQGTPTSKRSSPVHPSLTPVDAG